MIGFFVAFAFAAGFLAGWRFAIVSLAHHMHAHGYTITEEPR